jgi:hypothetical protein
MDETMFHMENTMVLIHGFSFIQCVRVMPALKNFFNKSNFVRRYCR